MKRRTFLVNATAAAITAGALKTLRNFRERPPDMRSYLDRQLTPAAAAQTAAVNAGQTGKTGRLGKGDIFWSVMWPYMYTVGKAEGTVDNSLGINPYQVIYTYDSFTGFDDHPRRAHPILDSNGRPTGQVSDAAGWPQFISTTWDGLVADNPFWYDGPAFQPANQDLGFLYLHRDTGAHAALMAGVQVDALTQRLTLTYEGYCKRCDVDKSSVTRRQQPN